MLRLVKLEKVHIKEAVSRFGFKSRSSYYFFNNKMKEQGFVGLFDMRPERRERELELELAISQKQVQYQNAPNINYQYRCSPRPRESIWQQANIPSPWYNAFYGLPGNKHRIFLQIIYALSEGNGVRGISRIFDVHQDTVLRYLKRAGCQCRRISNYFLKNLHVEELQLDEMWSFVYKKEKHLTEQEVTSALKGDQWCWIAMDAQTKVIVQYEIGKRTSTLANDLIRNFKKRTDGTIPSLVTSDGYQEYIMALLKSFGVPSPNGKSINPHPQMDYAMVKKKRKNGRVVDTEVKVMFGNLDRITEKLQNSPVSNKVNVSFVERCHLSRRQFNRRVTRKTMGFSKKLQNHLLQYELEVTIHNFVRPHRGIKYQTPMMAAGITDHVWSIEELLYFSKDN
jgi:IS1 family transposase